MATVEVQTMVPKASEFNAAVTGVVVAPISIKEILAKLNGVFPMDEAVVEGIAHL